MDIIRGKVETAKKIVVYGEPGVGKSTLAAGAPNPVFIDPSGGSTKLDVARVNVRSWDDLTTALQSLRDDGHEFDTVVIDELGTLEHFCWSHLCEKHGKASIEAFGYGKGYTLATEAWRGLLKIVNGVHEKGFNVVMIGHSTISTFRDPEGPEYDRHHLKLHGKLAAMLKEWAETVLFCRHETVVGRTESERAVAHATGSRVMHTRHAAAYDAKNRDDLPAKLPLLWDELETKSLSASEMASEINELSKKLSEAHRKTAASKMKEADGDKDKVKLIHNWVKTKAGETK